jgi:hypothetical protein
MQRQSRRDIGAIRAIAVFASGKLIALDDSGGVCV